MAKEFWVNRRAPTLTVGEFHVSHHRCWPWDLDLWLELNNGRALTLYDLGRLVLAKRTGLLSLLKEKGWSMPMAVHLCATVVVSMYLKALRCEAEVCVGTSDFFT